jgi:DNA-binding transcriptional regulator/RsmH inhibitor MraZ
MKTGRPPSWNPVASLAQDVWTDVVPLASKGRIVIPVPVRSRLDWLANSDGGILAEVAADHSVELRPWDPSGVEAMKAVRSALAEADASRRGEIAVAAMDRYMKLSVDGAGRMTLPPPLVSQLDAEISSCVRLVLRDSRLWLWSERRWQSARPERLAILFGEVV